MPQFPLIRALDSISRCVPEPDRRKLNRVLQERFPPPDKMSIRDEDGMVGVVTSRQFRRMDTMQRQDLIHHVLATRLTPQERRDVLIILGVAPEEEIANAHDETA